MVSRATGLWHCAARASLRAESASIPRTGIVTIGRSPDSDIFLDDITVSRHHSQIEHRVEGLVLRDLGSLNGTYVNRRRIHDEERLQNGDEVQIGKFRLVLLNP